MEFLIYAGLFFPLIGFLSLLTTSNLIYKKLAPVIGSGSVFLSFCCFSSLLISYGNGLFQEITITLYQWIPVDGIHGTFSLHLDPLSMLMTMIITGVGFLIHLYSIGYMEEETDLNRYFACLNFFVFSMLLLVLSANLLLLFVGWEGVGVASYLLIGFWYKRIDASAAAIKAFVVNRTSDLGFLLALLLTLHLFGTSDIIEITKRAPKEFDAGAPIIVLLTLLYFIGAMGKSAQVPLHIWLPDAMTGPTPVSALIHAATMVTAGVYLVVRLHDLFILSPMTLEIIGITGGITALFAALCALGQTKLKSVLAYSTISQLGFMFLGAGSANFYGAMFHLTMHAFIKGLLFLAAGNVLHMVDDITDMREMGGLKKKLPYTNALFLIGALSLSGIPPLAAFFSKDLILEQNYLVGQHTLFYIGLAASILTGVYLTRAYYLTFLGETRIPSKIYDKIKEAPRIMILPMLPLAFLSITGGFLGYGEDRAYSLGSFLAKVGVTIGNSSPIHSALSPEKILAALLAFTGILITLGLCFYFNRKSDKTINWHPPLLKNAFYFDAIYFLFLIRPLRSLGKFIRDKTEKFLSEQTFNGVSYITLFTAKELQRFQNGQIRSYTAWIVIGAASTLIYLVF